MTPRAWTTSRYTAHSTGSAIVERTAMAVIGPTRWVCRTCLVKNSPTPQHKPASTARIAAFMAGMIPGAVAIEAAAHVR